MTKDISSNYYTQHVDTSASKIDNVSFYQFDVTKTQNVGLSSHLYIFGFDRQDEPPLSLSQGFRIGARHDEQIFVNIGGTDYTADVRMTENVLSGVSTSALGDQTGAKKSKLSVPNTVFAMTVDSIGLVTGEKIRIFSNSGDFLKVFSLIEFIMLL